ncbi:MAG: MaoC family dehydratase N-terminal domain-containing protein [Pseudomonadota bacterium]
MPQETTAVGKDPRDWIGKVEERTGAVPGAVLQMLAGALDHGIYRDLSASEGSPLPPLSHWTAFPESTGLSDLGADGHPRLGRFLPPIDLGRRMWAGGEISFDGDLHVGEALSRRSEIQAIEEKQGGAGPMVFVKVHHRITGAAGGSVEESQDLVYLPLPKSFSPPKPIPVPEATLFDEPLSMEIVRLFRFSAATYNGHRIHYDLDYAERVEKYPGLVVHGPMQAMLLMEAGMRHAGRQPAQFRFRGVHPMFHDRTLHLVGLAADDDGLALCTASTDGHQGLQARIVWA